jgi:hypothetical protein
MELDFFCTPPEVSEVTASARSGARD